MNFFQRTFCVLALCLALTPFAAAQDCRTLLSTPSAGLAPAECLRTYDGVHDAPPATEPERSGPMDTAFGYDAVNDFIAPVYLRFEQDFPEAVAEVAGSSSISFINAGDFEGDDLSAWYALDFDGTAYQVDPLTGGGFELDNIGLDEIGDMAYDPVSEQFYIITSDCSTSTSFWTVDFDALTFEPVGTTTAAVCGVGLAVNEDGEAFLHDVISDSIYRVDLANGSATLVGAAGFDANFAQSMDFDNEDGTLYLYAFNIAEFNAFQPPAELRTVNVTTGATTLVGKITGSATDRQISACSSETLVGLELVTIVQSVPLPIIYDGMYKGTDTLTDTDSDSLAFGEDAGMSCVDVDFTGETLGRVADMSLSLFLDHGRLGDLVVKVRHDGTGTIFTPMNRPDFVFPTGDGPDDGSCMMDTPGCHGDTSDLSPGIPTVFNPLATVYAEDMGSGLGASDFVCLDGGPCLFLPDPDGIPGPSTFQGAFGGKDAEVVWTVCVGDAVTGNSPLDGPGDEARSAPGSFESVALTITGGAPAPPPLDLTATISTRDEVCLGGSFVTHYSITNNTSLPAQGDLFYEVTIEEGNPIITGLVASGDIPGISTVSGSFETYVPSMAPVRDYVFTPMIGRFGPGVVVDSEPFLVSVISCLEGSGSTDDWHIEDITLWDGARNRTSAGIAQTNAIVSAHPNPFTRQTEIAFSTDARAEVSLAVYDVLGREVARLVDGPVEAGRHAATFDADELASGIYVWRLTVNGDVQTGRLTLVR